MRSRSLAVMAALAVGLIALWFLTRQPPERRGRTSTAERARIVPPVDADKIVRVSIETLGTSAVLRRADDGRWYENEAMTHQVDEDAIAQVFKAFGDVPEGKLISNDPRKHLSFQVDPMVGKRVRLYDRAGEARVDVVVGKRPEMDFFSTYVRPWGEDETYLVEAPLGFAFDRPGGWRNKVMFKTDPADVTRIRIETTTGTVVLDRAAGDDEPTTDGPAFGPPPVWRVVEPFEAEADPDLLVPMTNRLRRFVANTFEDNPADRPLSAFGLDPAVATVTFDRPSSTPIVLKIGDQRPEGTEIRTAIVEGDRQIYRLTEPTYRLFLRPAEDFVKKEEGADATPAPADEEAGQTASTRE